MTTTAMGTTVLGYPRIGGDRELKRALESYWAGRSSADALAASGTAIRRETWSTLHQAGLAAVPSNTFSQYDHMLDAAVMVDAVPARYRTVDTPLERYFAMARGTETLAPLELTKWFDTNYHYLVPEIGPDTRFRPRPEKPLAELAEAAALGIPTRPVLVGPATFLLLAKPAPEAPPGFRPLERLDALLDCYAQLLADLAAAGAQWVQLDEPAYVADRTEPELGALRRAYQRLGSATGRPRLFVASYFGELGEALPVLLDAPVEAVGLDLVAGPGNVARLARHAPVTGRTIVAGLVDGRNVWRTDLRAALATAETLRERAEQVSVATSCSLLHVPLDLAVEPQLPAELRARLAFARQKVDEVVALGQATAGAGGLPASRPDAAPAEWQRPAVRARLAALHPLRERRSPYPQRAAAQAAQLRLPPLPTTTIGSFPQTAQVRGARAALREGRISPAEYRQRMRDEIAAVIRRQEQLGIDVLVHGEPERSDMVQYFAEHLDGFAATTHGWVQSYGSRCVRPPILYGDVARPEPITVEWASYAQSLTGRPVKGILTGPVTMLAWSFVRDDQPLPSTARQVALALRDEAVDLESAGIRIIQIDEPALRELLPLRRRDRAGYLDWAVAVFRVAAGGVADATQIHTHLCYSEFGDVLPAIDAMGADVTSLEASRSRMEVLTDLAAAGYARGLGPGVYDIHSPRVPATPELVERLQRATAVVPAERLWVNPDCGLKTRSYAEVEPALENLVAAARALRPTLARTLSTWADQH